MQSVQTDLLEKLSQKEEEISLYKAELARLTKNKNTIPLEKYEKILDQLNEEQKAHLQLYKNYEQMKKDNENLKQLLMDKSQSNTGIKQEKENQNNISLIDKNQSKFLEDGADINDFFMEVK